MGSSRAGLLSSLPDFGFAAVFLITWIRPDTLGPSMVKWLLMVMVMEFVIIHSTGFMALVAFRSASRAAASGKIVGIGLFYTIMAGGMCMVFDSAWPLVAFWGQTLNRLLGVILGQARDVGERALALTGWGASTLLYMVGAMITAVAVPAFGLTPEVVAAQDVPGGGVWVEQPERVMAFGILYFSLTGWYELEAHHWAEKVKALATHFRGILTPPAR